MRRSLGVGLIGTLVLICLAATTNGQSVFYGSTSVGGLVGIIDQINGSFAALPVSPTAGGGKPAIAFDSQGRLWGSENKGNPNVTCPGNSGRCGHLIQINRNNGKLVEECEVFQTESQGMRLTDFTFQPGTDRLFGLDTNGNLYTVQDPCLGAAEQGFEVFVEQATICTEGESASIEARTESSPDCPSPPLE